MNEIYGTESYPQIVKRPHTVGIIKRINERKMNKTKLFYQEISKKKNVWNLHVMLLLCVGLCVCECSTAIAWVEQNWNAKRYMDYLSLQNEKLS